MRESEQRTRGAPPADEIPYGEPLREPAVARARLNRLVPLFIIVSLLALALVPLWVNRRADALRQRIVMLIEPTLALAAELQATIAVEVASGRGYLLAGQPEFLRAARSARTHEHALLRALGPFTRAIGPATAMQLDVVRQRLADWHAPSDSLLAGQMTAAAYVRALPRQQDQFLAAQGAIIDLQEQISVVNAEHRAAIAEINREGLRIASLLIVLSLAATLAVAWIDRRQVQLLRALDAARTDAQRRARVEKVLRETTASLTASTTTEEVLRGTAEHALVAMGADGAVVITPDPRREEVEIAAVAGRSVPPVGARLAYRDSLTAAVLERGRAEVISRLDRYPLFSDRCPGCAGVAAPLGDRDAPIGALVLLRLPGRPPFHSSEIAPALALADLATLAYRRVELLETLRQRGDELARFIDSRSQITRGLSHDVKNPLSAADGFLELLEMGVEGEMTPEQRERVSRARRSIGDALRLIEQILEVARMEAGPIEVTLERTDVGAVAGDSAERHRAQAEAKRQELGVVVPDELPAIETDPMRVRRVLENLLSNAVKYTPEGGRIEVRVAMREDGEAPAPGRWLTIAVSDTGPGIPPDQQKLLFREFARLEAVGGPPGAGLGLAVSQRIAHELGGAVTVESEVGRGSTFTLWLPIERAAGGTRPVEAAA